MNFKESINKFVTCEIHYKNEVNCLVKLDNGNWVAVKKNGSLDWVEVSPADLHDVLTSMESIGAEVRFTNHSAV